MERHKKKRVICPHCNKYINKRRLASDVCMCEWKGVLKEKRKVLESLAGMFKGTKRLREYLRNKGGKK